MFEFEEKKLARLKLMTELCTVRSRVAVGLDRFARLYLYWYWYLYLYWYWYLYLCLMIPAPNRSPVQPLAAALRCAALHCIPLIETSPPLAPSCQSHPSFPRSPRQRYIKEPLHAGSPRWVLTGRIRTCTTVTTLRRSLPPPEINGSISTNTLRELDDTILY